MKATVHHGLSCVCTYIPHQSQYSYHHNKLKLERFTQLVEDFRYIVTGAYMNIVVTQHVKWCLTKSAEFHNFLLREMQEHKFLYYLF